MRHRAVHIERAADVNVGDEVVGVAGEELDQQRRMKPSGQQYCAGHCGAFVCAS
jgi:hypothetical protein